jgi:hypothetical protein
VEDGAAEELEDFVNEEHWRSKQKDELPLLPRQRHDVEDRRQPRHLHSTQHASERCQWGVIPASLQFSARVTFKCDRRAPS